MREDFPEGESTTLDEASEIIHCGGDVKVNYIGPAFVPDYSLGRDTDNTPSVIENPDFIEPV